MQEHPRLEWFPTPPPQSNPIIHKKEDAKIQEFQSIE
jgi:hypothetical protein